MNETLIFVAVALVLVGLFVYLAARRHRADVDFDEAATAIRSLDMEAFRNLVDIEEESFLRASLSARDFRKIKRERALAALTYVRTLSGLSVQFARFGDVAQRSPDPAVAASGKEIVNSATYLRLRALDATVKLLFAAAFPGLHSRPLGTLLDQYDRATYLVVNYDALKRVQSRAS